MLVSIKSPKGGTALVNPKTKHIVRYTPSEAYLQAIQPKTVGMHITPQLLDDPNRYKKEVYSKLMNAACHPKPLPCSYQEAKTSSLIQVPVWIHSKQYRKN